MNFHSKASPWGVTLKFGEGAHGSRGTTLEVPHAPHPLVGITEQMNQRASQSIGTVTG